jgi:hypothetical protein
MNDGLIDDEPIIWQMKTAETGTPGTTPRRQEEPGHDVRIFGSSLPMLRSTSEFADAAGIHCKRIPSSFIREDATQVSRRRQGHDYSANLMCSRLPEYIILQEGKHFPERL